MDPCWQPPLRKILSARAIETASAAALGATAAHVNRSQSSSKPWPVSADIDLLADASTFDGSVIFHVSLVANRGAPSPPRGWSPPQDPSLNPTRHSPRVRRPPPAVISRKMPTVGLPTLLGHASSPHMSTERLCPLSSGRWLPPRVRTWWHAQVRSLSLHHVAPGRSPASQTEVASASCDRTARASAAPCTLCARPRAHAMPHVMPCFTRAGGLCAVAIRCPCCSCVSRRSMLEAGRAPAALCARARAAASATARASTGRARASQGTRVPRALPPRRAPYRATTAACARPAAPAAVDGTLPLSLYLDIELLSPSFSPRPSRPRTATPARDTWRGLGDRARDMQISLISRRPPTATPPRGPREGPSQFGSRHNVPGRPWSQDVVS